MLVQLLVQLGLGAFLLWHCLLEGEMHDEGEKFPLHVSAPCQFSPHLNNLC